MLQNISIVFDIIMVVCFGASWPFNIIRSFKARTAKGTSIQFMLLIEIGYIAGIICKVLLMIENGGLTWLGYIAFSFYIINLLMVLTGIIIYFRNKKLDKLREIEGNNHETNND